MNGPARDIDDTEIERRFTHHPPSGARIKDHEGTRALFKALAYDLAVLLPAGREKSLAFTALEKAHFWAQAAIAREGK